MLKIIEGKEKRPLKIVIYGPEGIGKSTFASKFPDPLFIDTEGGTSNLDIRRIKCSKSWDELILIVKEIIKNPTICKTLVLDSADWSESMCIDAVNRKHRKTNIEDFGYGKGYVYLLDEYSKLLKLFDELIEVGINVVVTAHARPRKFELPEEQGAFDRYEMKLTRQVSPLLKEWCDALFFANYKIYVVTTETNSKKAQGGKRVLYTTHHPAYDAKNRFGLPEELSLDFSEIAHLFEGLDEVINKEKAIEKVGVPTLAYERLRKMMDLAEIEEHQIQKVVSKRGHYEGDVPIREYSDEFITRWIVPNWNRIIKTIKKEKGEIENE